MMYFRWKIKWRLEHGRARNYGWDGHFRNMHDIMQSIMPKRRRPKNHNRLTDLSKKPRSGTGSLNWFLFECWFKVKKRCKEKILRCTMFSQRAIESLVVVARWAAGKNWKNKCVISLSCPWRKMCGGIVLNVFLSSGRLNMNSHLSHRQNNLPQMSGHCIFCTLTKLVTGLHIEEILFQKTNVVQILLFSTFFLRIITLHSRVNEAQCVELLTLLLS